MVQSLTDRWAGQALFGTLTPDIVVLTLLYSIAGVRYWKQYLNTCLHSNLYDPTNIVYFFAPIFQLGIAIVNDFKSVEGDRALGLQVSYILKSSVVYKLDCG